MLLVVAGCGDSSSADDDGTEISVETGSLSKAEFIKQADAICEETVKNVQSEGEKYARKAEQASTPAVGLAAELPKFVRNVVVPMFEEEIDQISSLGAPSGDEQEITVMLKALQQGLVKAQKEPQALFQGTNNKFNEATQLGEKYGFSSCGNIT